MLRSTAAPPDDRTRHAIAVPASTERYIGCILALTSGPRIPTSVASTDLSVAVMENVVSVRPTRPIAYAQPMSAKWIQFNAGNSKLAGLTLSE